MSSSQNTRLPPVKRAATGSRRRPSLSDFGAMRQDEVARFAHFLHEADPLADNLVEALGRQPAGRGRRLLDTALDQGLETVDTPPAAMIELFQQVDRVPPWVDWDMIDRGGSIFLRSGGLGIAALSLLALPLTYSSGVGTKPLVFTGHLLRRAPRRLAETARFAVETSRPGGLRRFGQGFKFTIKVRLMHAQVRRLLGRSGRWNPEWGAPINQAFLAGTNFAMSLGLIEGVRQLGFRVTRNEAEALLHLWRYSGYLMGVDQQLLCSTEAEGRRLGLAIFAVGAPVDADSRALVKALMTANYFPEYEVGWRGAAAYGLSRALIGHELADMLGYPKNRWHWAVAATRPLVSAGWLVQRAVPRGEAWATDLGGRIWDGIIDRILAGARADFRAPERLENMPQGEGHDDQQRARASQHT
ncbi:oxygenase MpaB family protein [Aurantimonas sp. VKM B-3413]|uniref:oxygenase MpaB family protein n=1 Tax=Aurantimonas sp. VKM B-3413 TaxID=2779401 RepID=UPI001E37D407|nr:oxygenase MpaB family protein [Aurantimonas sp. VKM B-3413]MCB8839419.1 DUF2236 domain-containing protein [Aurantimonas sp. VKM B-3413]